MISALGAGGQAFAGTSLRVISGADESKIGVNSQNDKTQALRRSRVAESDVARSVEASAESQKTKKNGEELSEEEERHVQELKRRDAEVRAHEQAHATVGGSYASAPTYEYTVGPDGKRYAVSGEVQIDASPVRDNPEATIRKMDIVIRAALAPAEPSSQDLQVAKQAQATRAKAQAELQKQSLEEQKGDDRRADSSLLLSAQEAYSDAGKISSQISSSVAEQLFQISV